jgi:hypothetical protein
MLFGFRFELGCPEGVEGGVAHRALVLMQKLVFVFEVAQAVAVGFSLSSIGRLQ